MTEQTSPTPWWHDNGYGIVDANGISVQIYGTSELQFETRSLIIHAINSHAALIAAAKEMLAAMQRPSTSQRQHNATIALRAAIIAALPCPF